MKLCLVRPTLSESLVTLAALVVFTTAGGCADTSGEEEVEASSGEQALSSAPLRASCVTEAGNATFTIFVPRANARYVDRYRITDIVKDGISKPGTFDPYSSPLGSNMQFKGWNGFPLIKSALVTDTRVTTDWRGIPGGIRGHIKCVADQGPAPTALERFRLAYEYEVTDIFVGRRNPQVLKYLGTTPRAELSPWLLEKVVRTPQEFTTWEFEGQRLYMYQWSAVESGPIATLHREFYPAQGKMFAQAVLQPNRALDGEMLTTEEWMAAPKRTLYWSNVGY